MAIGAFLGRSYAALARREEAEAQFDTALGGLAGLFLGLMLIALAFLAE